MKRLIFALLFALSGSARADVFDDIPVNQWAEVSLNEIVDVQPSPYPEYANGQIGGGNILSFSGGFYDTLRNRLCIWGGGHGDYAGNEIPCFTLSTRLWSLIWGPTPNAQIQVESNGASSETYLDGNPSSRHTYGSVLYLPNVDRYFAHGGSLAGGSGGMGLYTWEHNPNTSTWAQRADVSTCNSNPQLPHSVYDPIRSKVYTHLYNKLCEYDHPANTWTDRGGYGPGASPSHSMVVFDSQRRRFYFVGTGVSYYDMSNDANNNIDLTTPTTTGDKTCEDYNGPGVAYDPVNHQIVCWMGGTDVYTLDTATHAWAKVTAAGGNTVTPPSTGLSLILGRFTYVPSKNVFIVVAGMDQPVYAYRLSNLHAPSNLRVLPCPPRGAFICADGAIKRAGVE